MIRILVVDDSLSVRKALEKILNLHAEVIVAKDAEDALEQLHASTVAPDLVITDVLMPGMSGFALAGELRRLSLTASTPVMLMSGIIDDDVHRMAHEVGASAVVRKPFTAEELLPVIRRALAEHGNVTLPAAQPKNGGEDRKGDSERLDAAVTPPASAIGVHPADMGQPVVIVQPFEGERPAFTPQPATSAVPAPDTSNPSNLPTSTVQPPVLVAAAGTVDDMTRGGTAATSAIQSLVTTLTEKPGVQGAMVTTHTGEPLAESGVLGLSGTDLGMYARFYANTASTLGRRLSGGDSAGAQLEYARCTVLILPLDTAHLLVCLLADANSVNMVRFAVRRHLTPVLT